MLKELLVTFLVCLVIGALINGWSTPPPPPADTGEPAATVEPSPGQPGATDPSGSEPGASEPGASGTGQPKAGAGKVNETSDASFSEDVLNAKVPVLVDFSATWCGPCKYMEPIVSKLAKDYAGKVKIYKLDIDENPDTQKAYDVSSIPTFIMFRDGKSVGKYTGAIPKEMLAGVLDKQLGLQ